MNVPIDVGNTPVVEHGVFDDVVIDLETLSLAPTAAMISIGAVGYKDGDVAGYFYSPISLNLLEVKGDLEIDTLNWWLTSQNMDNARAGLNLKDSSNYLEKVLGNFSEWYSNQGKQTPLLWGNGPEFDNAILKFHYGIRKIINPIPHWCHQSVRTIRHINETLNLGVEYKPHELAHHALYDADAEGAFVMEVLKILKGGFPNDARSKS